MSRIPGVSGLKKPTSTQNGTATPSTTAPAASTGPSTSSAEDPIGQVVDARNQAGGLGNLLTDAEAKKKNIPVYRAVKHSTMIKGSA